MTDSLVSEKSSRTRNIILALAAAAAVAAIAGFLIYSSICPCDRTPGGILFGDRVEEPVSDWSFANQVPLCQLQIYAGIRPHSINLNCMATPTGELYLSCSFCDTKYWAGKVGADKPARLRVNGMVYPVVLNREQNPALMDQAWAARVSKLQVMSGPLNPAPPPDAPRADRWWTFRVVSAI